MAKLFITLSVVGLIAQAHSQLLPYWPLTSNVVPYQPVVYHQAVPQQLLNSALHRTSPYLIPHFNSQQFQPTFYRSETEKLEDMIQQESRRSHSLTFDPNLRWLAAMHTKDQNAYADDGYKHNKQCNMHSWMSNTRPTGVKKCCFRSNDRSESNGRCMWDALSDHYKSKGWGPTGNVFEISHGGPGSKVSAQTAIRGWMKSGGHRDVITGNGWEDLKKFGCHVDRQYANCFFQK